MTHPDPNDRPIEFKEDVEQIFKDLGLPVPPIVELPTMSEAELKAYIESLKEKKLD